MRLFEYNFFAVGLYRILIITNSVTRGHPYKVMLGHCDNNSQKQFLPHRIANVTYQVTYQVRPHLIRGRSPESSEACRAKRTN